MRILIADDHPLYREALRARIERLFPEAAVTEFSSFEDVVSLGNKDENPYELFLLDFHMPGMSIDALKKLAAAYAGVPIAVISGTASAADVRSVVQAGVQGFIPKSATGKHLMHALQMLLEGGTSMPTDFVVSGDTVSASREDRGWTVRGSPSPPWLALLSKRELDVLLGVARGLSNKEIARELGLAEVTVKLHLQGVFRKIGARSRSEAAVIATKANLA